MKIVKCFGHLIEDVFTMTFCKYVFPNKSVKVNIHVLEEEIDVPVIFCPYHFLEFDDVGVTQLKQEHDLSVCSLRVGGVIEGVEVFL